MRDNGDHPGSHRTGPGRQASHQPRAGAALATLAALGLVVAVSIGVAAVQSRDTDQLRLVVGGPMTTASPPA